MLYMKKNVALLIQNNPPGCVRAEQKHHPPSGRKAYPFVSAFRPAGDGVLLMGCPIRPGMTTRTDRE